MRSGCLRRAAEARAEMLRSRHSDAGPPSVRSTVASARPRANVIATLKRASAVDDPDPDEA